MAGRIDENAIRDIRERANVFEVVSDVVSLRRRGRSAVGLCPFHAEKTPSFSVSEERGFFHCFGCGEHGDVFTFVMKTQGLPFPEAVRAVAQRFGLPVPEDTSGGPRTPTEPLVAVNAAAAAFFRGSLRGPTGARARAYLAERGVAAESVERFGLGFAPGGDALARHLRAQGLRMDDAIAAGLVLKRQGGSLLDRFRERLMFPIADPMGRVVAFGGRILPGAPVTGDPPPKYLNSPESPIFHKGRTVYGLGLARDAVRKRARVIVVEGYLDVVALAQAGIEEVVAPLGTALTADQLRVLRRFSETVLACFDGDTAGRRAAARSFPVFIEAGLWGRGVFLPSGDDPDTFVRTQGKDALEALLAKAEPLVDAYLLELRGGQDDSVGKRAEAVREVSRILRNVTDQYQRDQLTRLAALRLGVREPALIEAGSPEALKFERATERVHAAGPEELLVELLVADPQLAARIRDENIATDFESPVWRGTVQRVVDEGADLDRTSLMQGLPRAMRDRIVQRLLTENTDEDRDRVVADCIAAIRTRRARLQRGRLHEDLRAAQARGDLAAERQLERQLAQQLTEKTRT
jgi:DNA primase